MRVAVPAWVNVVLEGGGFKLERALVAYRQLSTLLKSDWRPRAREVEALASQILADEFETNELEMRAARRSSADELEELASLASAVAAARAGLIDRLGFSSESFTERLRALIGEAGPEALRWKAWERFVLERRGFTALSATFWVSAAAEIIAWPWLGGLDSSWGKAQVPAPLTASLVVPFVLFSYFRSSSWASLGVRIPKLRRALPARTAALLCALGIALGLSFEFLPIKLALVGTVLFSWTLLGWRLWRPVRSAS